MSKRKQTAWRRVKSWWADITCKFVATHGRFHLYRRDDAFIIVYHKGESFPIEGWSPVCNYLTPGAARKGIDLERSWDRMMADPFTRAAIGAAIEQVSRDDENASQKRSRQ